MGDVGMREWRLMGRLAAVACCLGVFAAGGVSRAEDTVTIGGMTDATGAWASYGAPTVVGMNLAVDQINAAGGLLGKKLVMKFLDGKTDIPTWVSCARELAEDPNIVAIHTGGASNEREAIRGLMCKNNKLYFYNHQFEGGICDKHTFATGIIPEQQVEPLVDYMMKEFGPRAMILSADYNYGHIATAMTKRFIDARKGEVLHVEYFPLDVTDFQSTLAKIQELKPNFIISHLVGANHLSFHRSMTATGLNKTIPVGAPVFGLANDHLVLGGHDSQGIYSALNYFEEIDTPASKEFVAAVRAKSPKIEYINNEVATAWNGIMFWAEAVKAAKSFDREVLTKELEKGTSINSPEGSIRIDGPKHQATHNIHIATVGADGKFKVIKTVENIGPAFACDLIANPDQHIQLEPEVK